MDLSRISTKAPEHYDKEQIKEETDQLRLQIGELQERLYAERKRSLLVIFQGMDASGKDGSTKSTFRNCMPIGLNVKAFKKPTPEELNHDFLWRVHKEVPEKGMIQVFVRSHYEDVLIQRVNRWITEQRVQRRFKAINDFERLLEYDNETVILKFYLHISKEKQEEKLRERLELSHKHWKHNAGDWTERRLWDDYRQAYHDVLTHCNDVPWHIIPADQRWYRNYCIAKIVAEMLQKIDPQYPPLKVEDIPKEFLTGGEE